MTTKQAFVIVFMMLKAFDLVAALASAQAAPQAVVNTTTAGDLTILDASKSTGALTWRIQGRHWLIDDGQVAICRGDYIAALAAVAGGQVDLILLPDGADKPDGPPVDDLTAKVRELAKRLPADQRAKVAEIHADLAAKAGKEITSADALFRERSTLVSASLGEAKDDWASFFSSINGLLDAVEDAVSGKAVAADFKQAFLQIAKGLE